MPLPRTSSRRSIAAVSAFAVTAALLVPTSAQAAASPDAPVVIAEVYGGGGNSGAPLNRDFIELHNTSADTVDLTGWSVQYASTGGSSWQVTQLGAVTLEPDTTLLIGQAVGGNTSLPGFEADVEGTIAMSGTGGKVALVSTVTALSGSTGLAAHPDVIDYVGWGAATDFAGSAAAPATNNTTSIARDAAGTNTVDNRADFTAGAPTPTGSGEGPVDPGEQDATIAEVQGTGEASPLLGVTVTTTGVVTAHYPTGGFDGYVIQTPGTGGETDLIDRTASDAVFVYAPGAVDEVALGDTVEVTGTVAEHFGLTQIRVSSGGAVILEDQPAPTPLQITWPTTAAERESIESMLIEPQGAFTVSNTYTTHQYGEVGLAAGDGPLRQPTDVGRPGSAEAQAAAADNAARGVVLDDGRSTNFLGAANTDLVPPYVSLVEPIIVGQTATLTGSFIVDWRNDAWKLNPTTPLVGDGEGTDQVTFENTRTVAPEDVGGDVSVASFNVLNYFTTLGVDGMGCVPYTDRAGNPITVREGCDQRGAWRVEDFERQQQKIVAAIEALDADVVGLMEIENSARLGHEADAATAALVSALNEAAGTEKWAYVTSPVDLPDAQQQDVITNAIIFQPAVVSPVGASTALGDQSGAGQAFVNAREPIAQAFAPAGGGVPFVVVVNHFKSKSSPGPWPGDPDIGDGQSASNESRVRQATALRDWIATDPTGTGTTDVLLVGDFNSYTHEDPLQVLYDVGFVNAASAYDVTDASYVFQGLSGSLDHVLLSPSAAERATGADVWSINGGESVALEYSRYNSNGTLFFAPDLYRSSDHDPVIVGLARGQVASQTAVTVTPSTVTAGSTTPVTVTGTVEAAVAATGTVEFLIDGTVVGSADLADGTAGASVSAAGLSVGEHAVVARYLGSSTVAPSESSAVTLTVSAPASTIDSVVLPPVYFKGLPRPRVVSYVSTADGRPANGTVEVREGDTVIGSAKVRFGLASVTLTGKLTRGTHTYTVTFVPSDAGSVGGSTDTAKLIVLF